MDAKFCKDNTGPSPCPHLALKDSDVCLAHTKVPKTIPEMFKELNVLVIDTTQRLDRIRADLLLLNSKINPPQIQLVNQEPELPTQPTSVIPRHFFLNEAHELPRIAKSRLRKERRAAREKREAEENTKKSSSVSGRNKSRSGRGV